MKKRGLSATAFVADCFAVAKEVLGGKMLWFRLVRSYARDPGGDGPDIGRVVFPYYESGKVITGPMESRAAGK